MASEPGGRSDKLGNEFERLWAVRHLIELIAGTATTFQLEALGDDEKGAEFWVGRPDGSREAHQCKRENGTAGRWSVADLEAKGVITVARFQLDRAPSHCFVFASADKAGHLSDLCERAGRCDNPAEFVTHLTSTSAGLKNEFDALCRRLDLDPNSSEGAAKAVDFLRRFRPEVVDKFRLRLAVEEFSARWIAGEPRDVVATLKDLLDGSIGRTLSELDVIAGLPAGARPRDLAKDPTLHSALDELRDRFDRSYRLLLIDGRPLGRQESEDLAAMLTAEDGPRLVLLHGPGGDGKSGVAFEVVDRLRLRGVACLPLRLDRDSPEDTPLRFGRSLGLPGSPAGCLAAVARGSPGILVLDQIDAIRWTAAHSAHAWDTCERTVAEALRHPELRVVVVCRSFDLEDDPRIKAWEKENKASRLKVGPLDDGAVDAVVASRGISPATLGARQRRVLRSPQGLFLWLALRDGDSHPTAFRTMTDLMRGFWDSTRRRLTELKVGQYEAALDALVSHMDRRGVPSAPRTVVGQWPEEVAALLSLNVLVEGPGGRLLFSHQSFLDHLTAVRILQKVHAGTGTVQGWLAEDDQSLFRRGQLRQVLTLLRDDDPGQFLDTMNDLLHGTEVRFHLQHLAAQMLGHSEVPTDEDVELVLGLLERPEWVDHVYYQILAGRESWFDALCRRNILRRWFEAPDEQWVNLAVFVVERVVETRGVEVESLLLDQEGERWPGRLVAAVWRTPPEKLTEGLFDVVIGLRRRGEWNAHDFVDWKSLAGASPARCVRMLEAEIGRDLDELEATPGEGEAGRRNRDDNHMLIELSSLVRSAVVMPVESWDMLVPCYLRASALLRGLRRRSRRSSYAPVAHDADHSVRRIRRVLRQVLVATGRAMARDTPRAFWARAGSESHEARSVQRLIDRCAPQGPDDRADLAIRRLLRDPSRLRSDGGDRGAAYRTAWKILRRYSGHCSDEVFAALQAAVLVHWPAEERNAYRLHHARKRRENFWGPHKYDVLEHNDLGLGQYLLLSGMPRRRLSREARDRLGVFRRKFGAVKPLLGSTPRRGAGWVGATISDDRLPRVSDRNWLEIVRRDWSNRSRFLKPMEPGRFGEVSVEMFARALGQMTDLQPTRFARLAIRMPVDCDSRYLVAILQSLAGGNPPTGTSDDPAREEATIAQIEAIIRRFARLEEDRGFAMSVCRVIRKRHNAAWGDDTLHLLSRLATGHPDPQPGHYAVSRAGVPGRDGESGNRPDVAVSSINCVRGAAAEAIKALLFDHPNRLGLLQSAIESLLDDPHAAVRAAAVGIALPLYNNEREKAVDAFLRACSHPDDRVLLAYDLNHFLSYAILDFADRLGPLIDRMVASAIVNVMKTGAAWAALAWAHRGLFDDIVSHCADGTRWQRMGVAEALANAVARGQDSPAVLNRLQSLFDDSEKEARDVASGVFRGDGFFGQPSAPSLAEAFLRSRALDDNVDDLLHGLEEFTGSLKPYAPAIHLLADRFAGPLAAEAKDHRTRRPLDAGLLARVLLRLYEQSEHDRSLRRRCLDAWDNLLRQGIGHDILQNVDA